MPYLKWAGKFALAYLLFMTVFAFGASIVKDHIPQNVQSQPGLVPAFIGFMLASLLCTLTVILLVLNSRCNNAKFALYLSLSYYCAVTFLMQLETWYFLSSVTISPQLLVRLFLMGAPTAFVFIPFANFLFGRSESNGEVVFFPKMQLKETIWKFGVAALSYVTLYFLAGYFIAWQNPELRAFYGHPGDALPFLEHMSSVLFKDTALVPFQILRSAIWILCALPIIANARSQWWITAFLVGLLFSVPQNIWHILENPLMPLASVRLSHFVETASSNFVFGVIVVWLFYPGRKK
jgi:hypothetical protein